MMQERWPPEPPRYDPPSQGRSVHAAWLVLAALTVLMLLLALIWGAQQAFPTLG
jgi:hypothetical protein